jgi:hypothetical protein
MTTRLRPYWPLLVIVAVLAAAMATMAPPAHADTLQVDCTNTTYVDGTNNTQKKKNFGSATDLVIKGTTKFAFVECVVAGVPTGATSISGTLNVFSRSVNTAHTVRLHNQPTAWVENTVTWNTLHTFDAAVLASAPGDLVPGAGESVNLLASTVTGNGTFRFALDTTTTTDQFYASDDYTTDITRRPKLTVTYTPAPPPPTPPTVTTGAASNITETSVTLNGTVNPNGAATTCHFDYGTTTGYGSVTPDDTSPGSGTTAVPVLANVTGLTANTLYHFRLSCTNLAGTTNGSDATFTTTSTPPPSCIHTADYGTPALAVTATPVDGCLIVDANYTLTSSLTINKSMQLLCQTTGTGFNAPNGGAFGGLIRINNGTTGVDEVTVDGCELYGTGAITTGLQAVTTGGVVGCDVPVTGCMFGAKLQHLNMHNIGSGYQTSSGSPQRFVYLTDSNCHDVEGSCAGFFGSSEFDISILRNTFTNTQVGGRTGNAAIQTGGTTSNAHGRFTIQGNMITNPAPCTVNKVGIGLDQISNSLIGGITATPGTGDGNLYEHCLPSGASGEGIVVNGPNNQIKGNKVLGVGNGSITLITYGNPNQANTNNVLDNNYTDGLGLTGGQGIALSFPSAALGGATPVTGLRVTNSTHINQPFGLQAYGYGGGTVLPGSDNQANNNNFGNGCAWDVVVHTGTGNTPTSCDA